MEIETNQSEECVKIEVDEDAQIPEISPKVKQTIHVNYNSWRHSCNNYHKSDENSYIELENGDLLDKTEQFSKLTEENEPLRRRILNFLNGKTLPSTNNFRTFFLNGKYGTDSFCDLLIDKCKQN